MIISFHAHLFDPPDRSRRFNEGECYYSGMQSSLKVKARRVLEIVIAFTPWVLSMYLFYWLQSSGTWTSDTPHRGKLSVMILGAGMLISFLIQSRFLKRRQK